MSTPAGLLDFFVLEASDYIEQLDGLVARAGGATPDPDPFTRSARSLRGSATMARLPGIAEIAANLERIGRGMRDGSVKWDHALQGAAVSAIDDLKILLRAVRTWGDAEDQRVSGRLSELARFKPAGQRPQTPPPAASGGTGASYLAAETAQIAAALDAFIARPSARDAFALALGRLRALRGVATLKDLPPLAEVVDALERGAKPVELGNGPPGAAQLALFTAGARVLRNAAQELATRGKPNPTSPEMDEFTRVSSALDDDPGGADRIVPVESLFFADAGPHVVTSAPHPPTTPDERFRLEVISQAEHLRVLIAECAAAPDSAAVGRLGRALRGAVRALQAAADSFGQRELAGFLGRAADRLLARPTPSGPALDARVVIALSEIAAMLADPTTTPPALVKRIAELTASTSSGLTPATSHPPVRQGRQPTPTGRELQTFLQSGIAGFSTLSSRPLSQPVPLVDETVVPIQTLLYSGRSALDRARELRGEIAHGGGAPSPDALAELFDLLDLAVAD